MLDSRSEILRMVQEEDVKFIRLQFVDIYGRSKNLAVTASQLPRALDGQVMLDGSSIDGFAVPSQSDLYLKPDPATFAIYPWRPSRGRVARLMCSVAYADGTVFEGDSRSVLQRACAQAEALGYTFQVGPECEFFLFQTDERGEPTLTTADAAGYFDLSPIDQGENVRREVVLALEEMGFQVECSHHETAPGQHEIDFRYSPALEAAEDILTFRLTVKTLAQRNGLHATFMPKPLAGVPGSGMHLNCSLRTEDGRNAFYDADGQYGLSDTAKAFLAGVMAHINGITALANPLVNSYKRLVPGYEAPCYNSWSAGNRTTLVRIPLCGENRGEQTRVELRSPDCACNPYLTLALVLTAGLDGIRRGLTPPPELREDVFSLSAEERAAKGAARLPQSLPEALDALEADPLLLDALGEHIAGAYIAGKRREWEEYRREVTDWERQRYMNTY